MRNTHPGIIRAREALGTISKEAKQSLKEQGMDLRGSLPHKIGQFAGTAAADDTGLQQKYLVAAECNASHRSSYQR